MVEKIFVTNYDRDEIIAMIREVFQEELHKQLYKKGLERQITYRNVSNSDTAEMYNLLLHNEFTIMENALTKYQNSIKKYNPKTIVEKLMRLEKVYDSSIVGVFLPTILVMIYLLMFFICNF